MYVALGKGSRIAKNLPTSWMDGPYLFWYLVCTIIKNLINLIKLNLCCRFQSTSTIIEVWWSYVVVTMVVWVVEFSSGGYKITKIFPENQYTQRKLLNFEFNGEVSKCTKIQLSKSIHGLRTPGEKIAFTAWLKIRSQSWILRYSQNIFCLPQGLKFTEKDIPVLLANL